MAVKIYPRLHSEYLDTTRAKFEKCTPKFMFQIIYHEKFFLSPKLVKTKVAASTLFYIARIFSEVYFVTIVFVDQRSRTDPLPLEKDQLGCYITK